MSLVYDKYAVRVLAGDVLDNLPLIGRDYAVLLTDPPYAAWRYITETEASKVLDPNTDAAWSANVFGWIGEWLYPLRQCMREDGVAWVFCNVHYLGFYLRWAKFTNWPLRGIFALPPDEFLLAFGPEPLSPDAGRRVQDALRANVYGQGKDVRMLGALLRESPAGAVLDPFMGQGTTLRAARRLARAATGVEIVEATVQTALQWLDEGGDDYGDRLGVPQAAGGHRGDDREG